MGRPRTKPLPAGIHERRYRSGRVAYWIDFRDQTGARVQELGGATLDDAVRLLAARRVSVSAGTFDRLTGSPEQTVAAYSAKWLELRRRDGVRAVDKESQLLRDHILPTLGAIRLTHLRPHDVAVLIRKLEDSKLAPKTVRNAHSVLSAMLSRARFDDLIAENPAKDLPRGVLPKNVARRIVSAWTRPEVEAWITPHDDVPEEHTIAYSIAALTGARVGEVAGMRWRDLDMKAAPLWRWALRSQYDGLPLKTGTPRDVPIHHELAKILEAWRRDGWPRTMCRHPLPEDFVVTRTSSRRLPTDPVHHTVQTLGSKAVRRHAMKLGVDWTGRDFHSFRRAMITLARSDGANVDALERVTHNASGTMIDGYTFFGWEILCAAVSCIRVARFRAVTPLRIVASGDADGDAVTSAVAMLSDLNRLSVEPRGVEPSSQTRTSSTLAALRQNTRRNARAESSVKRSATSGVSSAVTRVTNLVAIRGDLERANLIVEDDGRALVTTTRELARVTRSDE